MSCAKHKLSVGCNDTRRWRGSTESGHWFHCNAESLQWRLQLRRTLRLHLSQTNKPYSFSGSMPCHGPATWCKQPSTAALNACQLTVNQRFNISWFYNPLMLFYPLYSLPLLAIHTHLTALFPGLPRWASTRKVKPIWILLKQETVSGSGISWAICNSTPCSRQTTTPAPHHSVFLQAGCPSCRPTNSIMHWRHSYCIASAGNIELNPSLPSSLIAGLLNCRSAANCM